MHKPKFPDDPAKDEPLPYGLQAVQDAVDKIPEEYRGEIQPPLAKVAESMTRRKRVLELVQEALSVLRLDMKYLMFDLEATQRERDEYKRQVENHKLDD
ncbi:transcriptional regulator [Patescibacteria group bacterium]|nr:transcriptional regulator [Patescibacteria group bacterium]MBU2259834.1 transcriptional regulator [Patescibacteria group bacterium]